MNTLGTWDQPLCGWVVGALSTLESPEILEYWSGPMSPISAVQPAGAQCPPGRAPVLRQAEQRNQDACSV